MKWMGIRSMTVASAMLGCALTAAPIVSAQSTIPSGTNVSVRTAQTIETSAANGQVYSGTVDQDVLDASGRVIIPRGSTAELEVRKTSENELMLDLDSLTVNGQRFSVAATPSSVGTTGSGIGSLGKNKTTGIYVGGGAALGAIIGAIAGGGKGAAIGAATGAAAGAGAQILTHGRKVSVPAESVLTFQLEEPLSVVAETGYSRNGRHYHRY